MAKRRDTTNEINLHQGGTNTRKGGGSGKGTSGSQAANADGSSVSQTFGDDRKGKFHIIQHDSMEAHDTFVENQLQKSNARPANYDNWQNIIERSKRKIGDVKRFGKNGPKTIEALEKHAEFQSPEMIGKVRDKLQPIFDRIEQKDFENTVNQKKIAFNHYGLGIFSFDRAAMGLTRRKVDGVEKIVTNVRDVFAYHEKPPRSYRAIRIFLEAGATINVAGESMLYTGMAALLFAEYMIKKDYSVEINVLNGALNDSTNHRYANIIKVKRFEDSFDPNLIAVVSGDPAYFRYKGFKSIIAAYDHAGDDSPSGLGTYIGDSAIKKAINNLMRDDETGIFFGKSFSEMEAKQTVMKAIESIQKKEKYADKRQSA